jgi:hypothetical protein
MFGREQVHGDAGVGFNRDVITLSDTSVCEYHRFAGPLRQKARTVVEVDEQETKNHQDTEPEPPPFLLARRFCPRAEGDVPRRHLVTRQVTLDGDATE